MAETIDTLEQRWHQNLAWIDVAVRRHGSAYDELKKLIRRILDGPIDIGEYGDLASRITCLILELKEGHPHSVWEYYCTNIDPQKQGRAFQLRSICADLQHLFSEIDRYRRSSHGLTVIK